MEPRGTVDEGRDADAHVPSGETLRYACSLHGDEARRLDKEVTVYSIFTLVALLILASLTLGSRQASEDRQAIEDSVRTLRAGMDSHPELSDLTITVFLSLEAPPRKEWLETIELAGLSQELVGFTTLGDLDSEDRLSLTSARPTQVLQDEQTLERYTEKYADHSWEQFRRIPASTPDLGPLSFLGNLVKTPAPHKTLASLLGRYDIQVPPNTALLRPSLEKCAERVRTVRAENRPTLDLVAAMSDWNSQWKSIPVSVVTTALEDTKAAYEAALAALAILDPPNELYNKAKTGSVDQNTPVATVYARLLKRGANRLVELEQRFTAALYGIPIKFPLTPVLFAIPFLLPLYWLRMFLIRARSREHHATRARLVSYLLAGDPEPPLNQGEATRWRWLQKPMRWLNTPGNLQFGALQVIIAGVYGYTAFASWQALSDLGMPAPGNLALLLLAILFHALLLGLGVASRHHRPEVIASTIPARAPAARRG